MDWTTASSSSSSRAAATDKSGDQYEEGEEPLRPVESLLVEDDDVLCRAMNSNLRTIQLVLLFV
jgi:hypothetical protein